MDSNDGVVGLHLASSRGEVNVIDKLLTKNVDVDCCTNYGWTPLMCAARNGHLKAFQKLIDHGANILHTNKLGISVLSMAVASGNKEIIVFILKSLKNIKDCLLKEYLIFPFLIAIVYEDINLLRLFLDMREDLINITDKYGVSPLMIATAGNKAEMVNFLILSGVRVNENYNTTLDSAILRKNNRKEDTLYDKDCAYDCHSKCDNIGSDLIRHYGWLLADSTNNEDLMSFQAQGTGSDCKKNLVDNGSNTYALNVKSVNYNFQEATEIYKPSVLKQKCKNECDLSDCVPVPPLSPYSNSSNLNVKKKNYLKLEVMNNTSEIFQSNMSSPKSTILQNAEMSSLCPPCCKFKCKKEHTLGKKGKVKLQWNLSLSERLKSLFLIKPKADSVSSLTKTEGKSEQLKVPTRSPESGKNTLPESLGTSLSNLLKFMNLDDHILLFDKHEVDMQSFLMLDKRDLEEMGITCNESQQKLLSIIDFMKKSI